jgi:phage/plasmid-like protein (TIGR03299 family)
MHDIDMSNNRANIAFLGDRNDIWHRLGTQKEAGASLESWRRDAGLDWHADLVPAGAMVNGTWRTVENANFICRSDTQAIISPSSLSDQYKPVQPAELLEWFDRYIAVDERFALDVAGSLKGGSTIWATATYRDPLSVAGEKHLARILMTTTFDGSGATKNLATMTRAVCRNTIRLALGGKRAEITTRHNTAFNPERVGTELAALAQSFAEFKVIGDACTGSNGP